MGTISYSFFEKRTQFSSTGLLISSPDKVRAIIGNECDDGYALTSDLRCGPCLPDCRRCHAPGTCSAGACKDYYGSVKDGTCQPCKDPHCRTCDGELMCSSASACDVGYGLINGTCVSCGIKNCEDCSHDGCVKCVERYGVSIDGFLTRMGWLGVGV